MVYVCMCAQKQGTHGDAAHSGSPPVVSCANMLVAGTGVASSPVVALRGRVSLTGRQQLLDLLV